MKKTAITSLVAASVLAMGVAQAAGMGSTPNGKPFQYIDAQLLELRTTMETMEEQVQENTSAIQDLEAKASILENAIASNTGNIADLQNELNLVYDRTELLRSELSTIYLMLRLKQDILDGKCGDGEALQEIRPDGSIVCETTGGGGGSSSIRTYRVAGYARVPANGTIGSWAQCPTGSVYTGGGWASWQTEILSSYPGANAGNYLGGNNSWFVQVRNTSPYSRFLVTYAMCLSAN